MKSRYTLSTGCYSNVAKTTLQALADFWRAYNTQHSGQNTRKRLSCTKAFTDIASTGEITIGWDFGERWNIERIVQNFDTYPMEQRKISMAYQSKDWITSVMRRSNSSWSFSQVNPGEKLTWSGIELDLAVVRYFYEKWLGRKPHFSEEFVKSIIGVSMDPIKQMMVQTLLKSVKELVAQKSADVKSMRNNMRDEQKRIEQEFDVKVEARRDECSVKYAELVQRIQDLCPGYKVDTIEALSSNEW